MISAAVNVTPALQSQYLRADGAYARDRGRAQESRYRNISYVDSWTYVSSYLRRASRGTTGTRQIPSPRPFSTTTYALLKASSPRASDARGLTGDSPPMETFAQQYAPRLQHQPTDPSRERQPRHRYPLGQAGQDSFAPAPHPIGWVLNHRVRARLYREHCRPRGSLPLKIACEARQRDCKTTRLPAVQGWFDWSVGTCGIHKPASCCT